MDLENVFSDMTRGKLFIVSMYLFYMYDVYLIHVTVQWLNNIPLFKYKTHVIAQNVILKVSG